MAKNEINLTIKVTEKGNLKVIGQKAEKAAAGLDKAGKSARTADRNLKGAAQASANSTKNFSKMAQGISGGIVPAYATLAAQVFAVSAAFNFLKDAGSLRLLQEGQVAYAAATGTSLRSLTKDIQAATDAQLGFRDAAQAAAIGTAAGLDPTQITQISKAAKDASTVLGRDLTDSFNRLVRGITKAEPELLDELGIILRLEEATQEYKDALGITGELNSFQRSQAVANKVLGEAEEKYGKLLEATGGGANEFAKLSTAFEDIVNKLRNFAVDFLTPIATTLQKMPELIILAFAPFAAQIIGAALPGLENLGKALDNLGDRSKVAADKAGDSLKKALGKDELVKNSAFLQATLKKEVAENAKTRLKDVEAHKRSLLQKLKDGKQLNDAQIAQVRKNLQNQVRGYKIANKQIRGEVYKTLNEMERANRLATKKIEGHFAVMAVKVKGSITSIGITGKKVFASMVGFARGAAASISFALSAISWISLIASLGALAYSFFKSGDEAEKSASKYDYLRDKFKDLRSETEEFIKVQNILNDTFESGNKAIEAFGKRVANVSTQKLSETFGAGTSGDGLIKQILLERNAGQKRAAKEADRLQKLLEQSQKVSPQAAGMAEAMAPGAGASMYIVQLQAEADLQEEIDALRKKSTETLADYLKTNEENLNTIESGLGILMEERKALIGIENARFQQNTVVKGYLNLLDKLNKGEEVNIDLLLQQRDTVVELSQKISHLNRLQAENSQALSRAEQRVFPLSEYDNLLIRMTEEKQLLTEIAATQKLRDDGSTGLSPSEEKRLIFLKERESLVRSLADTEHTVAMQSLKIEQATLSASRGKTSLIKREIKLESDLLKNKNQQYALEQKIYQATLVSNNAEAKIQELRSKGLYDQANLLEEEQRSRLRTLDISEQELSLLKERGIELERQKDDLLQIQDAATQALETGLQRNIAALIKGEESSLKDAILNIAKGILDSIADQLATIMTAKIMKKLLGIKSPAEEMQEAMTKAARAGGQQIQTNMESAGKTVATDIENAMKRGASGATTSVPGPGGAPIPGTGQMGCVKLCPESSLPEGLGDIAKPPSDGGVLGGEGDKESQESIFSKIGTAFSNAMDYLFAKPKELEIPAPRAGNMIGNEDIAAVQRIGGKEGIFRPFLDSLDKLFSGDAPFLKSLGEVFSTGAQGFGDLFSGLFSQLGSLFGGGGGGGFMDILTTVAGFFFAKGGYAPGGFRAFAKGGVVNKPTLGMVGEGRHNEAIVPLPDGKSIPVAMKGAGQQNNNVTVNVSVDSSGNTSQDANGDQQGMDLGKVIANAVQQELLNQKRSGGILNPYGVA